MKTWRVLLLVLAAGLVLGCVGALAPEPSTGEEEAQAFNSKLRSDFRLPKMFDFERFKGNFKKRYHSALEEMFRTKLYMARAYCAFVSAVKYKFRAAKYYLGVNSRTDWTHNELDATLNHAIENDSAQQESGQLKAEGRLAAEDESFEPLAEPADIADELQRIHEHKNEPGFKELDAELAKMKQPDANRRPKRGADGRRIAPRAHFELSAAYERQKSTNRATLGGRVTSNNPNYEQPDVASEMSFEELAELPGWRNVFVSKIEPANNGHFYKNLPVKSKYITRNKPYLVKLTQEFVSGTKKMWRGLKHPFNSKNEPASKRGEAGESDDKSDSNSHSNKVEPDVVWVDHRQGGCLQPVQEQGFCGSCWAFAAMAFFEWAYCHETGSPVKFSEQYLVDCGSRINGIEGCNGAVVGMVAPFVHNFGLELERHYPYRGRQEHCPYDKNTEPQKMGYMRVEAGEIVLIPVELFEDYLPKMPIIINVHVRIDFYFYGGGVYDGRHCNDRGGHSVLLIGHGREDGEEYWLIRNSYSTDYGEQGHVRLNKNSNCIERIGGMVFGQMVDDRINVYPQRNWHVPLPVHKSAKANAGAKLEIKGEAFHMEMQNWLEKERNKIA